MKKALLLIDIQNDFCPEGALAVPNGNEVVPVANGLARSSFYDLVVATQDWHPPRHGSFASSHGKKPFEEIDLHGLQQTLWPDHCVQGSHGAAFHPMLDTRRIHTVVVKGTDPKVDSYSGFLDNGGRNDTGLHAHLQEHEIGEVHILGLATDYCVKFTTLDAVKLGYKATVVRDGCRGVNIAKDDSDKAFEMMRAAGAVIANSDSVWLAR